jgi:thiol-disulfide isomerase/thioredoxin
MEVKTPRDARKIQDLIMTGPITIVLVYSPSCPHCHTYMPMWKELCKSKNLKANMVSMKADTYEQTPLASKKTVESVPTVLFVDQEGSVTEAEEPRNLEVMKTAATVGVGEQEAAALNQGVAGQIFPTATPTNLQEIRLTPVPESNSRVPGAAVAASVVPAIPALPVPSMRQRGGAEECVGLSAFFGLCKKPTEETVSNLPEPEPEPEPPVVNNSQLTNTVMIGGAGTPWAAFVSALRHSRKSKRSGRKGSGRKRSGRKSQKKRTRRSA